MLGPQGNLLVTGPFLGPDQSAMGVDDLLLGDVTEPREWFAARDGEVGQTLEGHHGDFLQDVFRLDAGFERRAESALDEAQQRGAVGFEVFGDGGRFASSHPLQE